MALISALFWPPWQTIAQGSPPSDGKPRPNAAAFVAGSWATTTRFTGFLAPEDRTAVRAVDFRKTVIVAAMLVAPTPCYKTEIVGLQRTRQTLTVKVTRRRPPPGIGCLSVISWPYDVIAVPRPIIGRPLPTKIALRIIDRER